MDQPKTVRIAVGETAIFTVAATGNELSYQWIGPDGQPLSDQPGDVEGSNTTTLMIRNSEIRNAGTYYCIVSNSIGSATSATALLTFGK